MEEFMTDKTIMNTKEVAEYLGVSSNTVRLWRGKDRGPKFSIRGYKSFSYKREDVEAFAKELGYVTE
jgi:uncharacterized protein YjcR